MIQSRTVQRRLLAVDDHLDCAELITRVASTCGYDAKSTTNMTDLRLLLADWHPDVITLDLCMPDTDGIEVLSVLQKAGFKGQLIIISGQDDALRAISGRLAHARHLKIASNMQKPVNLQLLRHELGRLAAG